MDRRSYLRSAGAIALGVGCTGCLGGVGLTGSELNRTVGLAAPTSGPLGVLGGPVIEGGKVAVEAVSEGSDNGIEFTVGDTAASPETALSVARDMNDDGVPVISNTVVSDVGLALRGFCEEEQLAHVGTFVGNTDITKEGTNYTFRQAGNNRQMIAGSIQFFNEMDASNIAILSLNDSYGQTMVQGTKELAPRVDISVEHSALIPPGTTNFKPELSKIDNDAIDGIFIPYHGKGQTALAQQLREVGLFEDNVILGDYAWGGIKTFKRAAGDNAVGVHFMGVDIRSQEAQAAASRIGERFGGEVGTYRIVGYDTATVAARVIDSLDSADPEAIRSAYQDVDYEGISGWPVQFNDSGDNDGYQLVVNKWENADGSIRASEPVFQSSAIPGDDVTAIL